MNYDMAPSIARSDSFNINTFELDLDVTAYSYQQLVAHATIALDVLDEGAQDLWFDLVELTVDSVKINGADLFGKARNQGRVRRQCHLLNAVAAQLQGGAIIHFFKIRAHPGFQRKTAQQSGTKRVDRLNF